MRNFKTEGIVIRRRNSGEADRIITVFTKYHGKMQIKAAGVRRIVSRRSSHIELLNYSIVTLYKGHGMPVLTEAQTLCDYAGIKENLKLIGIAYHLCELVDSLCAENQENTRVFLLFHNTLRDLSDGHDPKQVVHAFEKAILYELGFSSHLLLTNTADTHAAIENILERKLKTTPLLSHFIS